jgi:hypothetical protein
MPLRLRYVDVSFTFSGKDVYGNTVRMPLQTEQTIRVDEFIATSDQYGVLVIGDVRYPSVCLKSFIAETEPVA